MPRPSKRLRANRENAEKARQAKESKRSKFRNLNQLIKNIAFLVATSFLKLSTLAVTAGAIITSIQPIDETQFLELYQAEIKELIHEYEMKIIQITEDDLREQQKNMKMNASIAIDGCWDHPRNGQNCIVTAIDLESHKVIDYQLIIRNNSKTKDFSNYDGNSNGMESNATKLILQRLHKLGKVKNIVHDRDARCSKLIKSFGNFTELFDAGHAKKSFNRTLSNSYSKNNKYEDPKSLKILSCKLQKYLNILIHSNFSNDERAYYWRNALYHFQDNHTHCYHNAFPKSKDLNKSLTTWRFNLTPEKINTLRKFLDHTSKYLLHVNSSLSTNYNECINMLKSRICCKDFCWGRSFPPKMALMVYQWNHQDTYLLDLSRKLGVTATNTDFEKIMAKFLYQKARRRFLNLLFPLTYKINKKQIIKDKINDFNNKDGYKLSSINYHYSK